MKKKIMIIEDDPVFKSILLDILAFGSFNCTTFNTVTEALAMFAHINPHLVLLDLALPRVDGTAFLETVKNWLPDNRKIPPIIVMSSHNETNVVDFVMKHGAVAFVEKPIVPAKLISAIKSYMKLGD